MLYIKILGMLLVVAASYGIGKTIGVYQNRRVEDIYELLIFVRMANGHLAYSLMEHSYLTDTQIGAVKELGKWLCYMDVDMQIRNLKLWEQNMQAEYEEQKDRARRINKVSRSLGLLGGIFLIILIG